MDARPSGGAPTPRLHIMISPLHDPADLERARRFLEAQGLRYEEPFDELLGAFAGDELVGVGARDGRVLKMIALAASERDGSLLGQLVTELVTRGHAAGEDGLFVFTRPEHAQSFERLNFALLAARGPVALLEYGGRFASWAARARAEVGDGNARVGAVVMNCNPFTRGHRHLVERAAAAVDRLLLFLVEEDRSSFPFAVRRALVQAGTADLANVRVLPTGAYAVSAVTFPAYFLPAVEAAPRVQLELDAALFAQRIAPAVGVRTRFVGTEPYSDLTRAYNAALARILPPAGVELVELPRLEAAGEGAISASRVRALLAGGGAPDRAALEPLVPPATLEYVLSPEARPVLERLRAGAGRGG